MSRHGRPANRLLSGNDILDAKAWVARRPKGAPEPTALQLDFIRASEEEAETRLGEQRKQLEAMAAAQAERETALRDREEALKQRARVARVRNIALVAVSSLALVAGAPTGVSFWSYVGAERQKQIAEQQKEQADEILHRAMTILWNLSTNNDDGVKEEQIRLFQRGVERGDPDSMRYLGMAYQFGMGVSQDFAKAREFYEK